MDIAQEFGKAILLNKEVIKRGSKSDIVTDYTFKNNFPLFEDLIKEIQFLEHARSVLKGTEKWLECTHQLISTDEKEIVVRFVFPYCG